jgi:L-lactate dehydrogenase complex protein LldG
MKRDAFLARVREAAHQGCAYRVHVDPRAREYGYQGAGNDPIARFVAEINTVGGQAQLVDNDEQALAALRDLLAHYKPRSALCWRHPLLDRLRLGEVLSASNIAMLNYDSVLPLSQDEQRRQMFAADIGITSADVAVAETGSIAVCSGPDTPRLASLLPPVHIAIVERSQIVNDLFDVFAKLDAAGATNIASNVTFITGPSKTGDLELRLTTGVHGPGHWHVIVIAGL